MASKTERDVISQRIKAALVVRKHDGKILGSPKGVGKSRLDTYRFDIEVRLINGSTLVFIVKRYKITEAERSNSISQAD
ncbi:MAG: hypothetical protein KF716_24085 [Anaerolineae bacterium]|nr:hypothetical protein [Anaerolineae bacterium]